MKTRLKKGIIYCSVFAAVIAGCKKKEKDEVTPQSSTGSFKVSIENVFASKKFFESGIYNTPVGKSTPSPIAGGGSFKFSFHAPKGSKLSLASMFGQSNDIFYASSPAGINLYNGSTPISGDITSQIYMWDAGTEVNQEPGVGPDQAARQTAPNTGTTESNPIKMISAINDGFTYPSVSSVLMVNITYLSDSKFEVTIDNISSPTILNTSQGGRPALVSPGVWVVHTDASPFFTENQLDNGMGLERLAEDGNPATIGAYASANTGYFSPIAPGLWVVHSSDSKPIYTYNQLDYNMGLEHLAEDADASALLSVIGTHAGVKSSGAYNIAVGASSKGPILPGQKFEFTISASQGDHLSFASMLGQSNDIFFAPADIGISLWNSDGSKVSGDVTSMVDLWDTGTEVNQYPGAGPDQAPRQAAPNTGTAESKVIKKASEAGDGYIYPTASQGIKVTITPL